MNLKTFGWIATATLVIVLLVWAFWPAPEPVSTFTVTQGPFVETIEDEGYARVRNPHRVLAPITGFMRRVELEPGDTVNQGDALFELEPLPTPALDSRSREQVLDAIEAAKARVALAEAQLEIQQSQATMAEAELARQQTMFERGFVSQEAIERATSQAETALAAEHAAEHAIEVAMFELKAAEANLSIQDGERTSMEQPTLVVRSPIDGTVINRERCCEGPINMGEPVLEIGDLSTLEVRIDLLSMDAVKVKPGMRVLLERWGGEKSLEGVVRRVEPRGFMRTSALGVEEQRVPVLIDITSPVDAWGTLGDGYRLEGRFILWEGQDVLQLPTSALFRRNDQWGVFVVEQGHAIQRPVEIGRRSGLRTEVIDGLVVGEQVIIHPNDRLSDGARVSMD
ncbi:MAG TPA: efflux RND transporter periplasmic adaptor subunit [Wenzhouxiangella sp.]